MLSGATEFPNAGSYGLLLSPAPPGSATAGWGSSTEGPQLVRIIRWLPPGTEQPFQSYRVVVSLPLTDGASGTKTVGISDLTDATPLTGAEGKEMVDLGRELARTRVSDRAAKQARHDALKQRAVYAPLLLAKLKELRAREASKAA